MHATTEESVVYDIKCCSCQRSIQSSDWVRRAKQNVYHLACFACDVCKRQLSTGEEFALVDNNILCKLHYVERLEIPHSVIMPVNRAIEKPPPLSTELDFEDEPSMWMKGSKNKRIRTSFSDEQVQVLQANFDIDANPDSNELERIASDVSLPKRVTQVWFQNSRARQKKQMQQQKMRVHHMGSHCSMCQYYPCKCSNPIFDKN